MIVSIFAILINTLRIRGLKLERDSGTKPEKISQVNFNIPNMMCEGCAETICNTLNVIPGVQLVKSKVPQKTGTNYLWSWTDRPATFKRSPSKGRIYSYRNLKMDVKLSNINTNSFRKRREKLLGILSASTFIIFFQAYMLAPLIPNLARLSLEYDLTQPFPAGIVTDVGRNQPGQPMGLNVFMLL